MKFVQRYRFLLRVVIVGSIFSFLCCAVKGLYSIAISMGGHGDADVLESKKDSNEAQQFFFRSILLRVVAILIRYRINKLGTKNSGEAK